MRYLSFERFADYLDEGREPASASDTEQSMLIEEVKVGCSLAMLQCLDRPHRIAFVLGDIMEWSGPEAAEVLDIEPALFRKRLQIARDAVLNFTRSHCGLVSDTASCQCNKRVSSTAVASFSEAQPLQFAQRATSFQDATELVRQVDDARAALAIYRTSAPRASTIDFARRLVSSMARPSDG